MYPPRVLLVLPDQWPRALLRAKLRERGYDAVGAPTAADALVYPAEEPEHGPVRLVIVDQRALDEGSDGPIDRLRALHPGARFLLLARPEGDPPRGAWAAVMRGPVSVDELLRAVERLVPSNGSSMKASRSEVGG